MPGLASLASELFPTFSERKADFVLTPVANSTGDLVAGESRVFQYFPDSLQDSRGTNWSPKDIPGGSLPLYQWVNGGERSLSFSAVFTSDLDPEGQGTPKDTGIYRRNIDVKSALLWLRSFMVPFYPDSKSTTGTPLTEPPRKVVLHIKNSGIGMLGGDTGGEPDDVFTIMTQCEIAFDAFWPSGYPRIATAQLAFSQVPQYKGTMTFPHHSERMHTAAFKGSPGATVGFLGGVGSSEFRGYLLGPAK